MAIRKEKRLSALKDKPTEKMDLSYEAGIDPQQEQLNDIPKKTEERQNTAKKDKLKG